MKKELLDARIVIHSNENATWQGLLIVSGQEYQFRSEMDLLYMINKLVSGIDDYNGWIFSGHDTGITDQ